MSRYSNHDASAERSEPTALEEDDDFINIPLLPKFGIIANFNAVVLTSSVLMVMVALNNFKGNERIYALSYLIPCFAIGAMAAIASILFGYLSVKVANPALSRPPRLPMLFHILRSSNLFFYTALSLMLASHGIFAWSIYTGASTFIRAAA
jgi:hypothetical protein